MSGLHNLNLTPVKGQLSEVSITSYRHDPDNSNSLSSNNVTSVFEDRAGIFWVATDNGLNSFDRKKNPAGFPALPNTGSLLRVNAGGTFGVVADNLDRPTSFEIIGNTAYIITLGGEIWTIDNIDCPPFDQHDEK